MLSELIASLQPSEPVTCLLPSEPVACLLLSEPFVCLLPSKSVALQLPSKSVALPLQSKPVAFQLPSVADSLPSEHVLPPLTQPSAFIQAKARLMTSHANGCMNKRNRAAPTFKEGQFVTVAIPKKDQIHPAVKRLPAIVVKVMPNQSYKLRGWNIGHFRVYRGVVSLGVTSR